MNADSAAANHSTPKTILGSINTRTNFVCLNGIIMRLPVILPESQLNTECMKRLQRQTTAKRFADDTLYRPKEYNETRLSLD
jgi:hypothetical protein